MVTQEGCVGIDDPVGSLVGDRRPSGGDRPPAQVVFWVGEALCRRYASSTLAAAGSFCIDKNIIIC